VASLCGSHGGYERIVLMNELSGIDYAAQFQIGLGSVNNDVQKRKNEICRHGANCGADAPPCDKRL
jgi:hypothetical protein